MFILKPGRFLKPVGFTDLIFKHLNLEMFPNQFLFDISTSFGLSLQKDIRNFYTKTASFFWLAFQKNITLQLLNGFSDNVQA